MNGAAALLSAAVREMADGPLRELFEQLPPETEPTPPWIDRFTIGKHDVGSYAQVTCTRGDGRLVSWLVEVWIYPTGRTGWSANVKAEIDLDESTGEDRCVLNDQQLVTDYAAAVVALARAGALVTGFPRDDLLAWGWEPAHWAEDDTDHSAHTCANPGGAI